MDNGELLDRYFAGTLTLADQLLFERRMLDSPAFRKTVNGLASIAREEPPLAALSDPLWDRNVVRAARLRQATQNDPGPRGFLGWLFPPRRSWAVSATAIAAAVLGIWLTARTPVSEPGMVEFILVYPSAQSVTVAGDFNQWDTDTLRLKQVNGVWRGKFRFTPGTHQYQFVVDKRLWMPDPASAAKVADDFGRENSVLRISTVQSL